MNISLPVIVASLLLAVGSAAQELIIVAPAAFGDALKEFVQFKREQMPVELVTLERVQASTEGVDDAEKLKRFLYERWRGGELKYVLLVGDADVMPVRYMVLDRKTPAAFDYAFYPSDLYYADLAKTDRSFESWNARHADFHAGYFGEVRGENNKADPINYDEIDYQPEIAVGRWPVSTASEAGEVAAKTIVAQKQRSARSSATQREVAFIGATGWVDTTPHFDRLEALMREHWKIERRLFTEKQEKENETALLDLWNRGQDVILHAGHGEPHFWQHCIGRSALSRLTNHDRLPVIFSAGCSTSYFAALAPYDGYVDANGEPHTGTDKGEVFHAPPPPPAVYQPGKCNKTGLGEELLRMPLGGAVAYIGCNTGSQPCALTLQRGFVEALSKESRPCLGDLWVAALRYYYENEHLAELKPTESWYPPSIFFQGMKFMLFGDPTLQM